MFDQHNCPSCGGSNLVRNGRTYSGQDRLKCKRCARQFVTRRCHPPLSDECKRRIELLLVERITLQGIYRMLEIKAHQLYAYIEELYGEIPDDLACSFNPSAQIELVMLNCEADELWSFVDRKSNKKWLWVSPDRLSRQVVALYVGDRGASGIVDRARNEATGRSAAAAEWLAILSQGTAHSDRRATRRPSILNSWSYLRRVFIDFATEAV